MHSHRFHITMIGHPQRCILYQPCNSLHVLLLPFSCLLNIEESLVFEKREIRTWLSMKPAQHIQISYGLCNGIILERRATSLLPLLHSIENSLFRNNRPIFIFQRFCSKMGCCCYFCFLHLHAQEKISDPINDGFPLC